MVLPTAAMGEHGGLATDTQPPAKLKWSNERNVRKHSPSSVARLMLPLGQRPRVRGAP